MKSLIRGVWLILTLNCEQSAQLTSQGLDRELNFFERWAVRFHNGFCKKSRRLAHQLRKMDEIIKARNREDHLLANELPLDARQRLNAMIRKTLKDKGNSN